MKAYLLNKRKELFFLSAIFITISLITLSTKGLVVGMDFIGGTKIEYKLNKVNESKLIEKIQENIKVSTVVFYTEDSIIIKITKGKIKEAELKNKIEDTLTKHGLKYKLVSFNNISPKFGEELKYNSLLAITLSFIVILFYILYRYEILFSFSAILTLVHDVIITLFLLSLLSIEINTSTIAAILTLIGYSLNDTIILFDRIRNTLQNTKITKLNEIINISIDKNLSRMFLTSLTTLFTITSLLIFGGEELYSFSITLFFGIIIGTYSSLFVSSTLLEIIKFNTKKYRKKYEGTLTKKKEKEDFRKQFEGSGGGFL